LRFFSPDNPIIWVGVWLCLSGAAEATAPTITTQPADQSVNVGDTATFSVIGHANPTSDKLGYQWKFNASNLAGETNASLILANVQLFQAGNYAVLLSDITHPSGTTLSANAVLSVAATNPQPQRQPNTTLAMPPALPVYGFTSTNAFPSLVFSNPMCIASPPGETNRLFIVEKHGRIIVITNLANPTRTIFMDISGRVDIVNPTEAGDVNNEEGMLSMAFHPGYATNRYFYVFYMGHATNYIYDVHDIVSRFRASATNPNQGDPNSETQLIVQYDRASNHNGGHMNFGPDGYLYISLGDEGAEYNTLTNGQYIDRNFFSGMLRIDVDKRPGSLPPNTNEEFAVTTNYAVPPDNPFIGATNFDGLTVNSNKVRTEFWAVGLRNPWSWSFDPETGILYCGDVGQDSYEEIDIITKGGNYGWAGWEGNVSPPPGVNTNGQPVAQNPVAPLVAYAHGSATNQGYCVIGGVVYRGQRFPQLYGAYVYGDYVSGNFWTLTYDGTNATPPQQLFADPGVSAIGTDPSNGDVLYANLRSGNNSLIKRITYSTNVVGAPLPATLAATGAFTNLMSLTGPLDQLLPATGIWPYDINVPFWSDNAIKSRWFSIPNTNLTIGFNSNGNWSFPTGTVWIKHFNLQLTNGDPSSTIRLETRLLVKNSSGAYGVTYRWGGSKTNAALVPAQGLDESFVINNGGVLSTQVWHYPSQSECLFCHTTVGGFGLGFRTEQLNRDFNYGSITTNEISALSAAGYFSAPVAGDVHQLLVLAAATNTAFSLEYRARSFLAANCSQCHQPGGTAQQANWDARITTPTAAANLVLAVPVSNLGNPNNLIIAPQVPTNSILRTRIAIRDLSNPLSIQMPPLASTVPDAADVQLITDWINSLPLDGRTDVPVLNRPLSVGSNLILSGTNGWPGQTYYLLASTNLTAPLANWDRLVTNPFDLYGKFQFTNQLGSNPPVMFYLLQLP
jgi:glucose/arabinose dehydrogenase